jgi:hypothetical protein
MQILIRRVEAWLLSLGRSVKKIMGFEMSMNTNVGGGLKRHSLIGCMALALLATVISLSLSTLTGWQWGESVKEKLVMAAFGVLAVLGAHLLLAICRPASARVRLVAIVLWLFCMAYVVYSHASFFLSSQQQAGMRRAAAVDQPSSKSEPKRNLTAILSDQAKIKIALAAKSQVHCGDGCSTLRVKVISWRARLDALNAEADDVKRWQVQQDRQAALKDAVRDDPVTMRLATWLDVTVIQIGLVTSLLFSFILEGMACLCWYLAFRLRDVSVTQPVVQLVTAVPELTRSGNVDVTRPLSELDSKVEELIREVRAGRLKLTVNGVRDYCRCAQKKATELKRLVEGKLNAETQAC